MPKGLSGALWQVCVLPLQYFVLHEAAGCRRVAFGAADCVGYPLVTACVYAVFGEEEGI